MSTDYVTMKIRLPHNQRYRTVIITTGDWDVSIIGLRRLKSGEVIQEDLTEKDLSPGDWQRINATSKRRYRKGVWSYGSGGCYFLRKTRRRGIRYFGTVEESYSQQKSWREEKDK